MLEWLIEKLPDDQREVLKMRYYKDLSFKEISEITDVSINTARKNEICNTKFKKVSGKAQHSITNQLKLNNIVCKESLFEYMNKNILYEKKLYSILLVD